VEEMQRTLMFIRQEFDKPVKMDWTPMFTHLEKMQPEVIDSVVQDNQERITRVETQMSNSNQETMLHLLESERRAASQSEELQEIRRQLGECQNGTQAVENAVNRTHTHFEELLRRQSQDQLQDLQTTMREFRERQDSMASTLKSIEPMIRVQLSKELADAKVATHHNYKLVDEIHTTLHDDVLNLFTEIGKIQKEMNISFVVPPRLLKKNPTEHQSWREMSCQTGGLFFHEQASQTDEWKPEKKKPKKPEPVKAAVVPKLQPRVEGPKKKVFGADEEAMKKKMRDALIKPAYDVQNFYYQTGCCQAIAKSQAFENITFIVIMLNAIWIAVDTDYNEKALIKDADLVFQIAENSFCSYFFLELMIRFFSFRKVRFCLRDFWFVFDFILVCIMVIETWVVTAVLIILKADGIGANMSTFSILRMVRLVKVLRMARMARLLRMVPELVVILRGISAAFRSVFFFMLLCVVIIYVYAVAFVQITKESDIGDTYFQTVPHAMNRLLLDGMLPWFARIVDDVSEENPLYWPAIVMFILLANVTVMNMLTGVLVEVVRTVAATEKEAMTVTHVSQQLREVMEQFQGNGDGDVQKKFSLSRKGSRQDVKSLTSTASQGSADSVMDGMQKEDFEKFVMQPEVAVIIQDVGVDPIGLIENVDMIYEDKDKEGKGLSFGDFLDVVLNMRGTNPSTVKDVKQQIRVMKNALQDSSLTLRKQILDDVDAFRMEVMEQLIEIRKKQLGDDEVSEAEELMLLQHNQTMARGQSALSLGREVSADSGISYVVEEDDED
jgi:voltage-gated sodium channel